MRFTPRRSLKHQRREAGDTEAAMTRLMLSGLLVLGAVGCAGTGGARHAGASAVHMNQDTDEPLVLAQGAITGPRSSLGVTEEGMNGRFRDQPVALRWTYQELAGNVGTRKTRLELAEGDDTRIWGFFAAQPVDLILNGPWLYGYVGSCVYIMQQRAAGFHGKRDCGAGTEDGIAMSFPDDLKQRPLGEKAALLSLTFANDAEAHTPANPLTAMTRRGEPPSSRTQQRKYQNSR
jgi:hypothetical protein